MTKILCTIWALILNTSGIYIFQTSSQEVSCASCNDLGSQVKIFFFAAGVYVIVARVPLFPSSFRQPVALILCLYELLATLFIIEFSVACIWSPIDVLLLTAFPKRICHMLKESEQAEVAELIVKYELPMALSYLVSFGFFLLTLHVTQAIDFSIYNECGLKVLLDVSLLKLYQRISREIPPKDPFVRFVDEPYSVRQRRRYLRCHSCCRHCR